MSDDPLTPFAKYTRELHARLRKGQEEYGNDSFASHPLDILQEIKEELLDVAGWSFIMLQRLEEVERKLCEKALTELDEG